MQTKLIIKIKNKNNNKNTKKKLQLKKNNKTRGKWRHVVDGTQYVALQTKASRACGSS